MKIKVKLFAIAKQLFGADEIELDLPEGSTASQLGGALVRRIPDLEPMSSTLRFAVNAEYAGDETLIRETDEVACIPPVSGG